MNSAPLRDFDFFPTIKLSPFIFLEFSRASKIRVGGERREVIMSQPGNTQPAPTFQCSKTT